MPSRLKTIEVPATPGNSVTTFATPVDGHQYELIGFMMTLVCDATVANRVPYFSVLTNPGGSVAMGYIKVTTAVTASQTKTWAAGRLAGLAGVSYNSDATAYSPAPLILDSHVTLNYGVTDGVAGDSYSGRILVNEISP